MAKQLKEILESFEFNRAALAKQRLSNLRHQGRRVRGARIANLMRAAGLKEEELDETELDQLDEVLSKDASAEDWIKDFVHSDAPQFQGKTKKERIKMALAARYKANEEVEIEEAKDTVTKDASGKVTSWKHEGDWKKAPKQHKDQFGNVIKDKNVARNLARQGMQQAMKEEYGIEFSDEDADTIMEGVLGALAGGTLAALATGPVGALAGAYLGHKVQQGANAKKKAAKSQNEEVELDEAQYAGLEKEDKPGKIKTAVIKTHEKAVGSETVEGWKDQKKPVKESYDEEGNLITMPKTFQQFMEAMTATKVAPNVTRYTGGSYGNAKGAKYGNTDYDNEDLEKKDDEGSETVKRGRGRPAGAKSGARGPRIK